MCYNLSQTNACSNWECLPSTSMRFYTRNIYMYIVYWASTHYCGQKMNMVWPALNISSIAFDDVLPSSTTTTTAMAWQETTTRAARNQLITCLHTYRQIRQGNRVFIMLHHGYLAQEGGVCMSACAGGAQATQAELKRV